MCFNFSISERDVANQEDRIKQYFLNRSKDTATIEKDNGLQNRIIRAQSCSIMLYLTSAQDGHQSEICDEVCRLHKRYSPCLDSDSKEFQNGLETNFPSRVFELVTARLIEMSGYALREQNSNLLEKKSKKEANPDLWTDDFFIECRANHSSMFNDWDKLLPYFDKYVGIIKYILSMRNNKKPEHPCIVIKQLYTILSNKEIRWMAGELDLSPSKTDQVFNTLQSWIRLSKHIRCHFGHLIPKELENKLDEVNIKPTGSREIDYPFISKRIVQSLIDKLQKNYFAKSNGVVSISIGFLIQGLQPSEKETHDLVDYFKRNYEKIFFETINNKEDKEQQAIKTGLKNLIGIMLDTNWYNWFGDILKKQGLASFHEPEQNNFFYLIYDKKHPKHHKLTQFRKTIQYRQELNFIPDQLTNLSKESQKTVEETLR